MEYIRFLWESAPEEEPPVILHEADTEHEWLAFRSVDIFAGGRTRNISDLHGGVIEITLALTVEESNVHGWGGEFHTYSAEKTEFEAVWESHIHNGALRQSGRI